MGINKFILYTLLGMYLCSAINNKLIINAKENLMQSIEDINYTAGVETVLDIEVPSKEFSFDSVGYTTVKLNIREEPFIDSSIMGTISFNSKVEYEEYNKEWVIIDCKNTNCYISKKYIADNPVAYTSSYNISNNSSFKSYMSYKAITNKVSKQYKIQQRAYTGNYGIRMVDDRYCVVLGSFFKEEVGTYFDLVLKNGTVIKCILSDLKSNVHTYKDNITSFNGCISEFIVDTNHLAENAKISGDISNCNSEWDSPVIKINFY